MGIMSGYIGYRAIGDFMKRNKTDLLLFLKPKKGVLPSFDIIREVLTGTNFESLANSSITRQSSMWISKKEWVSIDGKTIGGTVVNSISIGQSFISLVSLYCSKKKLVLGNAQVTNGKESEIPVVQQLIETLGLEGLPLLDALHCQKKRSGDH